MMKDEKSKKENNRYKCIKLLGEGSYGKAFLVKCADESLAVVKTIFIDEMDDEEKKAAYMESKILENVDHPNIVKFKEVYISKKPKLTLCIVMDFADGNYYSYFQGGDMKSKIKEQNGKLFSESQIIDWFTQICLSIKHIHDKKIIHRDIKSGNIFLTMNGLVKLGDFGIAKCLKNTLDKAKTVVGTPYYLSPEIIHNQPYSFKSDIWSLGVLLYEMCCLKMPFDGNNIAILSMKIIKAQYNPIPCSFSKELRILISNILNIDPNKRPTINDILKNNLIKSRIKIFLNEIQYNKEFSNTFLKNENNRANIKEKINGLKKTTFKKDNLYDKYKNHSNTSKSNKFNQENKKISKKQDSLMPIQVNNKRSYVNFYEKKKLLGYLPKDTIQNNKMMTQTLTEFIKTKEYESNIKQEINECDEETRYQSNNEEYKDEFNDYQDYVNTHKLLLELDKINEEEESTEEIDYTQEITQSDKNVDLDDVVLEEDLITYEEESYEENGVIESDNIDETETISYSEFQEIQESINNNQSKIDNSEIESEKIELEKFLGDVYFHLYDIIKNYYNNVNSRDFNNGNLMNLIKEEFSNLYDSNIIENCLDKIPDVFNLIAKEKLISRYKN